MKFSHRAALLSAAAASAAVLAGCSAAKPAGSSDLIMIGANLEMTGSNASFGTSSLNGIHMAVEDANISGGVLGKKIQVIGVDNRSEVAGSADALAKLVENGVSVIIGPDTSSNVIALAPQAAADKIPVISPSGTNPAVTVDPNTGKTRDYLFRACFTDPYQGRVMADFAADRLKARKAVVLVDNSSDYSKGLAEFFTKEFQGKGGQVPAQEAYMARDVDFKPILTKAAAFRPDIIFVPGYYQEVGLIIRQARAMGIDVPFGGGDGWDSPTLAEIAGADALNGTYYSNHYAIQEDNKTVMDFVNAYKAANNEEPGVFGALTYDTIKLLAQVIKDAGSADPQKIADGLASLKTFSGVTGDMSFTDTHDAKKAAFILTYKDGKPVFADKISAD